MTLLERGQPSTLLTEHLTTLRNVSLLGTNPGTMDSWTFRAIADVVVNIVSNTLLSVWSSEDANSGHCQRLAVESTSDVDSYVYPVTRFFEAVQCYIGS